MLSPRHLCGSAWIFRPEFPLWVFASRSRPIRHTLQSSYGLKRESIFAGVIGLDLLPWTKAE
jgi:hypothetical protein